MGKNNRVCMNGRMIMLIGINSELFFVFQKMNKEINRGIVMVLDDDISEEKFVRDLIESIGGTEITNLKMKNREKSLRNYKFAIHKFRKADEIERLQNFLDNLKCLNIITVRAVIPDVLKGLGIPIKITSDMAQSIGSGEFAKEMKEIREFVRSNPEIVVREIKLSKPPCSLEYSSLALSMTAAANVYYQYLRNSCSDIEQQIEQWHVKKAIEDCLGESDKFYETYDLIDAIQRVTTRYFDVDTEYTIADIGQIDGNVVKAIESGSAVIYDAQYYYVSEMLFRKACEVILNVSSFVDIKRSLKDEGTLCCNNVENTNFTVKKVFINVYGATCRGRFLKFRKEFFVTREGLTLEERRCLKNEEKSIHRKGSRITMSDQ